MKKLFLAEKRIICLCLAIALMLGGMISVFAASTYGTYVKKYSYSESQPFFNDWLENSYIYDSDGAPNKWYASKLKPTTNTTNFCSLGATRYENINGKTVTVDSFYRVQGESLNDPNYGMGMLIYQCIEYKVKHPEKDVEIWFSSYRVSPVAAVCIDPDSKWYGYMRSLYDCEYDSYGFVRISFMLVEAAKMGIEVHVIPQLNSYGTYQDSDNAKGYERLVALYYKTYFSSAMSVSCYSEYADGKTVSDYFTLHQMDWDVTTRGTDMHHIKTCIVSNYTDKYGVDHGKSTFLTSSNLDDNNYRGCNGNGGSQSGVIVSDHNEIYNVTRNYLKLLTQYTGKEDVAEFRDLVRTMQTEQIDLINAGLESTIPEDEKIVYLGSETDDVFEMYFTPLPGSEEVWDTEYNPYCRYLSEMLNSDDYIICTWNMAYYQCSTYFEYTFEDIICEAFHKNKNVNNRIYLQFPSFDESKYNDLIVGQDIGFKAINTNTKKIHSKDLLFSYSKDGQRKYVSIITSCNFGSAAFWGRSNSVLVIKETEENHGVFTNLGAASTNGAITQEEEEEITGFSCENKSDRYSLDKTFDETPLTFEAYLECDAEDVISSKKGCTIIGNYMDTYLPGISFRIYLNGCPSLCLRYDRDHQDQFTMTTSILGAGKVHVAFTIDSQYVYGYLNGKLVLQKAHCGYLPELNDYPFSVGGDIREDNSWWFRDGSIYSLNVFSAYRTQEEIKSDIYGVDIDDPTLLASYDFTTSMNDASANGNNIQPYYFSDQLLSSDSYDYTIVAVGDTQTVTKEDPDCLNEMYQFIVDNVDSMKIVRVLGMGDITNDCTDEQWAAAKNAISLLDGVVPYSLIRGNHDAFLREDESSIRNGLGGIQSTKFDEYFNNSTYAKQYDGRYMGKPENTYSLQTIYGVKYLFINLDFGPSDDVLEWAGNLCDTYSDRNVIISTHCFLFRDGTTLDSTDLYPPTQSGLENDGDGIWEKLGSKHSNISIILCGHDPINNIVTTKMTGDSGNTVTCFLIDQQYIDKNIGLSGMLTFLHFSDGGKTVTVETYSTAEKKLYKVNNQFTVTGINVVE